MTDLNQTGKTLLDETMKANQAAGLKPQAIPAARKGSGFGVALIIIIALGAAAGGAWVGIPAFVHAVREAWATLSDISRMGLWLCAAAVLHASCSRRK